MPGANVQVRDVTRKFQLGSEDVWAVNGVTLNAAPGEFLALVGRSGSGKTTLLNLIAGLDKPTGGEIAIDGKRVDQMSERELTLMRRAKIGFIFQSFGLLPLLSAHENVELPLRIAGFKHGERVIRAKRALEIVGLTRRADHRPYELSGGEQQRAAIARAIATEPALILADEPTGELDSATATVVLGLLRKLAREQGITVIACTHDRIVMDMADRVEELADGKLLAGAHGEVWGHVQAKPISPFAAAHPDRASFGAGVSSLIGADTSHFGPQTPLVPDAKRPLPAEQYAQRTERVVHAEPHQPEPLVEAEPTPEPAVEDGSQWARPRG
ncbi:MAG: ABC transporter ATP-binding protein [Anaerolineaceae bacterium]